MIFKHFLTRLYFVTNAIPGCESDDCLILPDRHDRAPMHPQVIVMQM
jgi:hypothetical protein